MKDHKIVFFTNGEKFNETGYNFTKEEAEAMVEANMKAMQEIGCTELTCKAVRKLNEHEKVVAKLISQAVSEYIGGYENTMLDFEPGCEEYEEAKAFLSDHNGLVDAIYREVMLESKDNTRSHIRFAGKQFILDRIESRLAKEGY